MSYLSPYSVLCACVGQLGSRLLSHCNRHCPRLRCLHCASFHRACVNTHQITPWRPLWLHPSRNGLVLDALAPRPGGGEGSGSPVCSTPIRQRCGPSSITPTNKKPLPCHPPTVQVFSRPSILQFTRLLFLPDFPFSARIIRTPPTRTQSHTPLLPTLPPQTTTSHLQRLQRIPDQRTILDLSSSFLASLLQQYIYIAILLSTRNFLSSLCSYPSLFLFCLCRNNHAQPQRRRSPTTTSNSINYNDQYNQGTACVLVFFSHTTIQLDHVVL